MFLRKSRSIEALHAKARKDDDAVSVTSKKSARSLLPKRSLRFLRGRRSEHEPMPTSSADTSLASAPDLSPMPQGERPNAGLGILHPGDTSLPGGPAAQPLNDAAFFSEARIAGLGMRLPPQHRLGSTPELPQTPKQGQDALVEQGGPQATSPGVDLHSLRFQSPNAYAAGRSALANSSSPARLYKPPQQAEALLRSAINDQQWRRFQEENELNIGYGVKDVGSFRISLFRQRGTAAAVVRRFSALAGAMLAVLVAAGLVEESVGGHVEGPA